MISIPFSKIFQMYCVVFLCCLALIGSSSARKCGVTDFLEQLIQSVQTIQQNGHRCGSLSEPLVGKAGPVGPRGPQGPPGEVDMVSVEQMIRRMIDESVDNLRAAGGLCYMGMKSGLIPNSAITARSFFNDRHAPFRARLDNRISSSSTGSWSSKRNEAGEWLQVDFGSVKQVAGVITQGRPQYSQWVTTYKVSCGTSQNNMVFVTENGREKVFDGNYDRDTKIYNRFPAVLSCRFIRIHPQAYSSHMSMRVEFVPAACFNRSLF